MAALASSNFQDDDKYYWYLAIRGQKDALAKFGSDDFKHITDLYQ